VHSLWLMVFLFALAMYFPGLFQGIVAVICAGSDGHVSEL
jgi:hypothetical protein